MFVVRLCLFISWFIFFMSWFIFFMYSATQACQTGLKVCTRVLSFAVFISFLLDRFGKYRFFYCMLCIFHSCQTGLVYTSFVCLFIFIYSATHSCQTGLTYQYICLIASQYPGSLVRQVYQILHNVIYSFRITQCYSFLLDRFASTRFF